MPNRPSVETPLLKAFLLRTRDGSEGIARLIVPVGWLIFILGAALGFERFEELGVIVPAVLGWGFVMAMQSRLSNQKPRLPQDEAATVIRDLRQATERNRLYDALPAELLGALEEAVLARDLAQARVSSQASDVGGDSSARIESTFQACFRAVGPVVRSPGQSSREWQTVLDNRVLVSAIADAVRSQSRALELLAPDDERKAALDELGSGSMQDVDMR
jgi:hypothetical protein